MEKKRSRGVTVFGVIITVAAFFATVISIYIFLRTEIEKNVGRNRVELQIIKAYFLPNHGFFDEGDFRGTEVDK